MKHFMLALMVGSLGAVLAADSADARGLRGLFGGRGHGSCCEPVCCEPQPVCCERAPVCCEPDPCSGHHGHRGRLFGGRKHSSCCDPCNTCGTTVSDCGCQGGGAVYHSSSKGHGAPTEASPSDHRAAPEPPTAEGDGPRGDVPPPPGAEGGRQVEPDGAVDAAAANQDA